MVEALRRRERERVIEEVAAQMAIEHEELLQVERAKIRKAVADSIEHEQILAENQKIIEVLLVLSSIEKLFFPLTRAKFGQRNGKGKTWRFDSLRTPRDCKKCKDGRNRM